MADRPDSQRLFLALLPDEGLRLGLAAYGAQWQWPPGAVRYAPADWHLTLHFIGSVPVRPLADWAAALAVPFAPFRLQLGRPERWPHGLAVLCPMTNPAPLLTLQADLALALQATGVQTDPRPFRPHLTLARHASQAHWPEQTPVLDWPVRSYALMQSTGQPDARYRLLQRFDAASGAARGP